MVQATNGQAPVFRTFQRRNMQDIPGYETLDDHQRLVIDVVSRVLPFKTNNYVCEQLIDWSNVPADPIYQLTFPQEGMIDPEHFATIADMVRAEVPAKEIDGVAHNIQRSLNPHPSGQVQMNVPPPTASRCQVCSTSTTRPCCSSPPRARPATPTAPTASAGRSSCNSTTSSLPPRRAAIWCATCGRTPR